MRSGFCLVGSLLAVTTLVTLSGAARADDQAAAQALFVAGREAMKAGDYAKACPMFEESFRLAPGDGTRFNLGDCYEKTGRTASAWAAFRDVAASSKLAGQRDREQTANARAASLESALCKVAIDVSTQTLETIVVFRDGAEVRKGQWGIPIPVDAGDHLIEVRYSDKKIWESKVHVASCPATSRVVVPVLTAPRESVPESSPGVEAGKSAPNIPSARAAASSWRPLAIVSSFGLGVLGAGLGTYFGIRAIGLRDDSNAGHCTGNTCDDVGRTLRDDSRSAGTASTITFIAGGAFLALGVLLWVTDSKAP